MKIKITFFLFSLLVFEAMALVPIEGSLYGRVNKVEQFDPFVGMLNASYIPLDQKEGLERAKLTRYFALYKQGNNLINYCEKTDRVKYANKTSEDTAIRSTVANLQYIGLDFSIRSIANYTKLLEFSDDKYQILYSNLVNNSCSQNITVFSHKMLKANFKYFRKNPTKLDIPSISNSPYFGKSIKAEFNTREEIERSLYYSLQNFRSLCSWNGSTDSFGMLTKYINNPFLMSFVFSNMLGQKINVDEKTEEVYFDEASESIQVACENLICRRKSRDNFKKMFPTINGNLNLDENLKVLYCSYLQGARRDPRELTPEQVAWTKNSTKNSKIIETMNLVGQITGFPDMMIGVDRYNQVSDLFRKNIKERWDTWAQVRSAKFNSEQLYEESLEVTVAKGSSSLRPDLGKFQIDFNIDLGEIDKLLGGYDKISTTFSLNFPVSYFEDIKKRIIFYASSGRSKNLEVLENDLILKINHQLKFKHKFFKVPLWDERMGAIIARELMGQVILHRAKTSQRLSKKFIKVPVNFHFGIFALQYIRDKNKSLSSSTKALTLKQ